jgi:chorismate synthase
VNTFGTLFRMTTFGESHGPAVGCVVDGCPSEIPLDKQKLYAQMARRRPGQSALTTPRQESDEPEILSGIYNDVTLGTPIAMLVRNRDTRSSDYDGIKGNPRLGHADAVWKIKFGHVDHRGGGRSSGRETAARVMAGWVAESLLAEVLPELRIVAWVSTVGCLSISEAAMARHWRREEIDLFEVRCPEAETAERMSQLILRAKENGDSLGGSITVRLEGVPPALGEPVFQKLSSYLAGAFASIGTINLIRWNQKPLELKGSEFHTPDNTYGGINGGISNGEDILFHIWGKPVSTIGDAAGKGRHDPCILPRAVPVVESMAAIAIADLYLLNRVRRIP